MKSLQYYRAMLGICRQRVQMDGEDVSFWLEETDILEKLITNAERSAALAAPVAFEEEKSPPMKRAI